MKLFSDQNKDPKKVQEFVSLLTEHQEILRLYIRSLVPPHVDPRDILQEVNIKLWQRMDDFKMGSNFGAWSCTVAYYAVLTHRKKQKRESVMLFSDDLTETIAAKMMERASQPDRRLKGLGSCLQQLKPAHLELLQARYDRDAGGIEAYAQRSQRSSNSLYVTLSRIRASLKKCIEEFDVNGGVA